MQISDTWWYKTANNMPIGNTKENLDKVWEF